MPLETGTDIGSLNSSNPAASDGLGQADDHLRLIKAVLKATFPSFTGATDFTHTAANSAVAKVLTDGVDKLDDATVFAADADTGLTRTGADTVALTAGGTDVVVASTTGAAVTGTLSATGALSVTGAMSGGTGQLVPVGTVLDYAGLTEPTGYLFCYGQAVSRTTYAALFAVISTTYGVGDGSTTFNLPDLRGRVIAGQDDMGGVSADRLTNQTGGLDGDTLGASGGAETHTLTTAQMPAHIHAQTAQTPSFTYEDGNRATSGSSTVTQISTSSHTNTVTTLPDPTPGDTQSTGGDGAHNNVQPTFILNKIIKT